MLPTDEHRWGWGRSAWRRGMNWLWHWPGACRRQRDLERVHVQVATHHRVLVAAAHFLVLDVLSKLADATLLVVIAGPKLAGKRCRNDQHQQADRRAEPRHSDVPIV